MIQLYMKKGRRYKPVKEFEGFPVDGIWLVKTVDNSRIQTCLVYLGEPLEKFPKKYEAILKQFREDIIKEYIRRREEKSIYSYWDEINLALEIIADFIEKEV